MKSNIKDMNNIKILQEDGHYKRKNKRRMIDKLLGINKHLDIERKDEIVVDDYHPAKNGSRY